MTKSYHINPIIRYSTLWHDKIKSGGPHSLESCRDQMGILSFRLRYFHSWKWKTMITVHTVSVYFRTFFHLTLYATFLHISKSTVSSLCRPMCLFVCLLLFVFVLLYYHSYTTNLQRVLSLNPNTTPNQLFCGARFVNMSLSMASYEWFIACC